MLLILSNWLQWWSPYFSVWHNVSQALTFRYILYPSTHLFYILTSCVRLLNALFISGITITLWIWSAAISTQWCQSCSLHCMIIQNAIGIGTHIYFIGCKPIAWIARWHSLIGQFMVWCIQRWGCLLISIQDCLMNARTILGKKRLTGTWNLFLPSKVIKS